MCNRRRCRTRAGRGSPRALSVVGRDARDRIPGLRIVATEPADSPILSKGIARKHKIMGTAPGFIPDPLDTNSHDEIVPTTTEAALLRDALSRPSMSMRGVVIAFSEAVPW